MVIIKAKIFGIRLLNYMRANMGVYFHFSTQDCEQQQKKVDSHIEGIDERKTSTINTVINQLGKKRDNCN